MKIRHYRTFSGREPVREFIDALPPDTQAEVFMLLRRLESGELLSLPHSRNLASMAKGLSELRVRDPNGQVRIFYYTKVKDVIFLVHGLRKKSRTIQNHERALILRRLKEITK